MLAEKIQQHNAKVWLVNTGWSGGSFGVGTRIKLHHTRAIIDAIHSGALLKAEVVLDPTFGFQVVKQCAEVPNDILVPKNVWSDKSAFDKAARKLANLFVENFKTYESGVSDEVKSAGPMF